MPDTSAGQPPTQQPARWTYDLDPVTGASRANFAGSITAPGLQLVSPILTGDPQAPTPATADNDTSIATTAFVKAQGPYLPLAGGALTGPLSVTGNLSASGGLVSAGKSIAFADANYNYIYDNAGLPSIKLGRSTGDYNNFHQQQSHWFQSISAVNYCQLTSFCYNVEGVWRALSGRELKQDIEPYTRGLTAILALNPVRFRYQPGTPFAPKDAPSDRHIGMIAEDVRPHLPELVGEHTFRADADGPEQTSATLAHGGLVFALVNAVKELAAKVTALETREPGRRR